jgi:hypothetical protein
MKGRAMDKDSMSRMNKRSSHERWRNALSSRLDFPLTLVVAETEMSALKNSASQASRQRET